MKNICTLFSALALTVSVKAQPCIPGKGHAQLDINNVKTTLLNSGDLWWDLMRAKYEVPKGGGVNSLFVGALWIGGIDPGGQLHTAAMTYRQTGIDYWPGPLDTTTVSTTAAVCNQFDRIWKVDRKTVNEFRSHFKDTTYIIPKDILEWPGNGDVSKGQTKELAPYIDVNGDGFYNAHDGDYPAFNFTGVPDCSGKYLQGDQVLWWIFNDMGNNHTETKGLPMGVEIQCQAFAFKSIDEIGNTTFYQYKITNRSSMQYNKVYVGQWVDVDLGYPFDDYVGCDVKRGMGIGYNGNPNDGSGGIYGTYGVKPPAIGIDFLGGPKPFDSSDGKDSLGTSFVDSSGRIQMSHFIYYNNDFTVQGNPTKQSDYYNYLRGYWIDGTPLTYGGTGKGGTTFCDFMLPGASDPSGLGTGGVPQPAWSEISSGNPVGDRRFLMSAGPFTMKPGSVQTITVGVIWAQDIKGGDPLASVKKLQVADDRIQNFFNSCFDSTKICNVPNAAINVTTNELDASFTCPVTATAYTWYFGDGAKSNLQNSSHSYSAPGQYTVSLNVTYSCGSDSISKIFKVFKSGKPLGVELQRMEGQGNGGWVLDMLKESVDSIFTNPSNRVLHPKYIALRGPVAVDVLDSTLLPKGKFSIQFSDTTKNATWKIFKYGNAGLPTDTVYSTTAISVGNYQVIPQWGLAVEVKYTGSPFVWNEPILESTMEFSNPSKNWLSGLSDKDTTDHDNWIRSGNISDIPAGPFDDYYSGISPVDNFEFFEKILGRTWAPYRLCAFSNYALTCTAGPAWDKLISQNDLRKTLASVDIILTSDKSKWTRCPVLELAEEITFAEGGARKLDLRESASVDKNGVKGDGVTISSNPGDAGYIAPTGMGWFPGYAINLETGERLNMAFGEDSGLPFENGRDMLWNPTENIWSASGHNPLFGGKHYIYVFAHTADFTPFSSGDPVLPNGPKSLPRYDGGLSAWKLLNTVKVTTSNNNYKKVVYTDAMWVNIPLLTPGHSLLETDVKVRIRVAQPYKYGFSAKYGISLPSQFVVDTLSGAYNKNMPLYNFDSNKIVAGMNKGAVSIEVSVYPNPFDRQATFVFGNIPDLKQLTIYDISGKEVRTYINIVENQFVLQRGNLSSGVYFYHVMSNDGQTRIGKLVIR